MKERKTIIEFKKTTIILRSILNTSAPPPLKRSEKQKHSCRRTKPEQTFIKKTKTEIKSLLKAKEPMECQKPKSLLKAKS